MRHKKAQYTPSPWHCHKFNGYDKWIEIAEPAIQVDYDDVDQKEQEANARLAEAAPELLEALIDLREWHRDEWHRDDTYYYSNMTINAVVDALIKRVLNL